MPATVPIGQGENGGASTVSPTRLPASRPLVPGGPAGPVSPWTPGRPRGPAGPGTGGAPPVLLASAAVCSANAATTDATPAQRIDVAQSATSRRARIANLPQVGSGESSPSRAFGGGYQPLARKSTRGSSCGRSGRHGHPVSLTPNTASVGTRAARDQPAAMGRRGPRRPSRHVPDARYAHTGCSRDGSNVREPRFRDGVTTTASSRARWIASVFCSIVMPSHSRRQSRAGAAASA